MKELIEIQNELKVLKDQSKAGIQFNYRTCEQIFQEVKPLCQKHGVILTVSDEAVCIGERYYIKATATVQKDGVLISASGYAREPDKLISMSFPQITGSCSSYARKTAMGGLFNLDDNHDPDGTTTTQKGDREKLTDEHYKLLKKCVEVLNDKGLVRQSKGMDSMFNENSADENFEKMYTRACNFAKEEIKL